MYYRFISLMCLASFLQKQLLEMKKAYVFIILCLVVASGVIAYHLSAPCTTTVWPICKALIIMGVTFHTGSATIFLYANTRIKALSISGVRVNNVTKTVLATGGSLTDSGPYDLAERAEGTITISLSWTSGNNYTFEVRTNKGKLFPFWRTAP